MMGTKNNYTTKSQCLEVNMATDGLEWRELKNNYATETQVLEVNMIHFSLFLLVLSYLIHI
jgi:hypothetical protein